MDNERLVVDWQGKIAELCAAILGRQLTECELNFIQRHAGFMALEAIENHVQGFNGQAAALASYLNSGVSNASA